MQEKISILSETVNKWLHQDGFKYSWPVYGAHIVENCMKRHALLPRNYIYIGFNPNTESLEFKPLTGTDFSKPTRTEKIKAWLRKKLS